jgi:hypothetical protein
MGGLKESLREFRDHHAKQSGHLLNMSGIGTEGMQVENENGELVTVKEGQAVGKDEIRLPYKFQGWPKAAHHPDGTVVAAKNDKEFAALTAKGFRADPYPIARPAAANLAEENAQMAKDLKDLKTAHTELLDKLNKLAK